MGFSKEIESSEELYKMRFMVIRENKYILFLRRVYKNKKGLQKNRRGMYFYDTVENCWYGDGYHQIFNPEKVEMLNKFLSYSLTEYTDLRIFAQKHENMRYTPIEQRLKL